MFGLEITDFAEIYVKIIEKAILESIYRDNIDQIEGILFVKDLLPHLNKDDFDWVSLIRDLSLCPKIKIR
jgi:Mg2+/Co2+ transporter CorC